MGKQLIALLLSALVAAAFAQAPRPAPPASAAATDTPDCERLWREYRRSQACYARFRTLTGLNGEAFRTCGAALPDPSAQCGPVRDPSSSPDSRR